MSGLIDMVWRFSVESGLNRAYRRALSRHGRGGGGSAWDDGASPECTVLHASDALRDIYNFTALEANRTHARVLFERAAIKFPTRGK